MKPLFAFFLTLSAATAADLTLLDAGKSDYQIVLPDAAPTPAIDASLQQTARLLQTAFLANKAEIAIVREKERDVSKPALMLGNTVLAQKNGLDVTKLRDWSYVQRVVGQDVILAGNDQASKAKVENVRRPNWDRVGTAKAAVDFARQFARRDCVRMKRAWSIGLVPSRKYFPLLPNLPSGDAEYRRTDQGETVV